MVRGNRKFIVASTLLALPVALLMASLTIGKSPNDLSGSATIHSSGVKHAVGTGSSELSQEMGVVQQVGLLETFAQKRSKSSASQRQASGGQKNGTPKASTGLLSGLLGDGQRPKPTPTAARPLNVQRPPADWNGIPFHEPRVTARSQPNVPIRDPSKQSSTRIIRGRSTRSIPAVPASARRDTRVIAAQPATRTRVIKPLPAPQAESTASARRSSLPTAAPLSSNNSSRRSDRRTVDVLNPNVVSADGTSSRRSSSAASDELIPKVSRRELPAKEEEKPKATKKTEKPADAVALAPSPNKTAPKTKAAAENTEKVAIEKTAQPAKAKSADVASVKTTKTGKSQTEASATEPLKTETEKVAAAPKTTSAVDALANHTPAESDSAMQPAPTSTLSSPTATGGIEKPYTTPSDSPASQPIPVAGIPSHPYAASTPSAPVSHRSGPPAGQFQPHEAVVPDQRLASPTQPNYNAASAPIGSGLLPQLPGPGTQKADAYIAAAPTRSSGPRLAAQPVSDPYRGSAVDRLQAPPATTPLRSSAPQYSSDDTTFDTDVTDADMQAAGTRHLKQGDTAVASELPGIRVITNGPSEIMIRQTQQYEIRVENRGSIDAQGVMVRAMIPDWADVRGHNATHGNISPQSKNSKSQDAFSVGNGERLVWTLDHLPAGTTERMFIRLRAERSGSHGVDVDWTLVPQKSVTKVHVHEPQLTLVIDGPPEVIYGRSQTYKVRVMNPGDGIAPNVVFTLSPNSATPQTQRIGDIPAGKEAQFEVELTAQDLGDLKIHGLASGDLELRAEASKTIHVAAAKLEAIMNGPELKYQNTEAVYHLQVKNNGNAMTEQVVATLQLPGGAKFLGGIVDSMQRGQVVKWKIDALAPGATRDYEFKCNMTSTGDQLFAFDCKGTAAAETSVSIATTVESIADLVLTINDPVAPAPVSTEVAYEIVVRNRGSREATEVRAIAQFSHGIEPKRLEGHSGEVLTGQVLFDPIPRIAAGEEVRLRIVAEAQRAGHHRFRSEIRSGATVLVAEEATHYMNPKSDRVSRSSNEKVLR